MTLAKRFGVWGYHGRIPPNHIGKRVFVYTEDHRWLRATFEQVDRWIDFGMLQT